MKPVNPNALRDHKPQLIEMAKYKQRHKQRHKLRLLKINCLANLDEHEILPEHFVSKNRLAQLIEQLQGAGFHFVDNQQAKSLVEQQTKLEWPVLLMFEGAWQVNINNGTNLLNQKGLPYVVNIKPSQLDGHRINLQLTIEYLVKKFNIEKLSLTMAKRHFYFCGDTRLLAKKLQQLCSELSFSQCVHLLNQVANQFDSSQDFLIERWFEHINAELLHHYLNEQQIWLDLQIKPDQAPIDSPFAVIENETQLSQLTLTGFKQTTNIEALVEQMKFG